MQVDSTSGVHSGCPSSCRNERLMSTNLYLERLRAQMGTRYSQHTVEAFGRQGGRFLIFAGMKRGYSRDEVLRFVDTLVKAGYKQTSINTILAGVRAMFHANELPWPLQKRDLHLGLPEVEEGGAVVPAVDIGRLIAAVRGTPGYDRVAVALSTTYGFRPSEIVEALAAGCDGRLLKVQTSKQGRVRRHTVPKVLVAALCFHARKMTTDGLHSMFDRLMKTHVRPAAKGEGWHGVRRALVTGLFQAHLADVAVHRWFGWKSIARPELRTSSKYYRPDPVELDHEVYAVHPFLRYWI